MPMIFQALCFTKLCREHKAGANKQSGVSMVEVLVALIVMSVGLLGIASLYVTALQAKSTSLSRMKAVNLAYDLADRIRANPSGIASYVVANALTVATPTETCMGSTNCTPAQMAAADLGQWKALISDATTGLPGNVTAVVEQTTPPTATTPSVLTIRLGWSEKNITGLTYNLQVQI